MITKRRREAEQRLIGVDAAPLIRRAAKEIWEESLVNARKKEEQTFYTPVTEIDYMVFEEPNNRWRAETLREILPNQGLVKVTETNPAFLLPELKHNLSALYVASGMCNDHNEARKLVCSFTFKNRGTVTLKDNGRSRI